MRDKNNIFDNITKVFKVVEIYLYSNFSKKYATKKGAKIYTGNI